MVHYYSKLCLGQIGHCALWHQCPITLVCVWCSLAVVLAWYAQAMVHWNVLFQMTIIRTNVLIIVLIIVSM